MNFSPIFAVQKYTHENFLSEQDSRYYRRIVGDW